VREFSTDQCTDRAAAVTYYAVLSLFPALIVVVSLLGVFGQGQRITDAMLQIVGDLAPASAVDTLGTPIQQLIESPSAGLALIVGILGAVWSASGYVRAFSRAMNRIYEIEEARPVWKLRPIQLVLTLVGLTLVAAVAFMLAVSGPIASAVGGAIGLGDIAHW
jgi:membrane protein